jgi:hypothetical protein
VRGRSPQRNWREGDDWAVLVEVDEDATARRLTRAITTFRLVPPAEPPPGARDAVGVGAGGAASGGARWRRDHEVHQLRLYDRREIDARLRAAGFRVRPLRGYGALRFGHGLAGFCASKPG